MCLPTSGTGISGGNGTVAGVMSRSRQQSPQYTQSSLSSRMRSPSVTGPMGSGSDTAFTSEVRARGVQSGKKRSRVEKLSRSPRVAKRDTLLADRRIEPRTGQNQAHQGTRIAELIVSLCHPSTNVPRAWAVGLPAWHADMTKRQGRTDTRSIMRSSSKLRAYEEGERVLAPVGRRQRTLRVDPNSF